MCAAVFFPLYLVKLCTGTVPALAFAEKGEN